MASDKDKVNTMRKTHKKKNKRYKMLGNAAMLLAYAQLLAGTVLMAFLYRLDMVPVKYFVPAAVVIVVMALLSWVMSRYKKSCIVSIILSILLIGVYSYGTYMVRHGENVLKKLTGAKGKEITVSLFVLNDGNISSKEELKGKAVGYSTSFDKTHVEQFISDFNKDNDFALTTKSYGTVKEEIDDLLAGKVSAIVMNKSYLSMLEDVEGYEDVETKIKELCKYTYYEEIESELEPERVANSQKPAFMNAVGYNKSKTTMNTSNFDESAFVVYLSGSDTREAVLEVSRSDVNILAFVNPNKGKVLLVNTPRDSFVSVSKSPTEKDKLTHVGNYGVDVSMDTLGLLYGITPKYYLQVNFVGFETVIDALGGITVTSSESFWAYTDEGVYIKEGENQVNGRQALAFVRERYAFPDSDNERGRNQMQVIKTVVGKVVSPVILTNYTEILNSMVDTFKTNMSADFISSLVKYQLDENTKWEVETYAIKPHHYETVTNCYSCPGLSVSATILDETSIEEAIEKIQDIMSK